MREGRDLKNEKLTPTMLCDIQRLLTEGTLEHSAAAGRFRSPDEPVVVADSRTNEVVYTPPDAAEISGRIREICDFANADSRPFIHPVVKAAVLHFAMGYVHP